MGWINIVKSHNLIVFRTSQEESLPADSEVSVKFKEIFKELCKESDPKDVLNTDVSSLFYKELPNKSHVISRVH